MLTPLLPLALAACRGDCARAEATQQERAEAPASPAGTRRSDKRAGLAPRAIAVPAPWYFTLQPTAGSGVRIASMDIRSFTAPLLEPGDIILAVDGRPVESMEGLEGYLRASSPGEMMVVTVLRNETKLHFAMLQVPSGEPPPPSPGGAAAPGDRGG